MSKKGVKTAISVAFYPIKPLYSNTLIDLFNWIINDEPNRTRSTGLTIFPAIGIHPRSIPQVLSKENLQKLKTIIQNAIQEKKIIALGEIGLDSATSNEIEVFEFQLQIAKDFDFPVIVHTPKKDKKIITEKIIESLIKKGIEIGVLDHINNEIIDLTKNINLNLGLTVQIGKLTPEKFYEIINKHPDKKERLMLNSDLGRDEADLYSTIKAIEIIKNKGISEKIIELIASRNAKKLFKL